MEQPHPANTEAKATGRNSRRYRDTVRVTQIGAVLDTLLGVVKIFVGLAVQSQALIADGIHSLSDLATDAIVLYAARHSHQDADEEHPYGHGRFETVATVGLGVALIGVAVGIAIDAALRLFKPEELPQFGVLPLIVAGVSIVSKEAIYRYTMKVADKYNSDMLRANAWHSRSDAISSIIVLIGVAGSMVGMWYLDAVAAIGVGIMIAKIGWDLAWSSVSELVDTSLEPQRVEAIRRAILAVDGVKALHILRTRRMAGKALVDVHIQVDPHISVSEGHYVSEAVHDKVTKEIEDVADVMVHIDPEDDEAAPLNRHLPSRHALQARLEQAWQGVEAAADIKEIKLHYLDGRIEVDLILPLSVLGEDPCAAKARLQQYFESVRDALEEVSVIRLYFQ